jgi:hypothetical protein
LVEDTSAGDNSSPTPERSHKRIYAALPLRITYWDNDNKPCLDSACTYDISSRGARITSPPSIKEVGEIIAIERGRNRAFCRVVWVGKSNSALRDQIGIECVESDRLIWEAEMRDLEDEYDPIPRYLRSSRLFGGSERERRRHGRFPIEGTAEWLKLGADATRAKGVLKDLSEVGCLLADPQLPPQGSELVLRLNVENCDLWLKGQVKFANSKLGAGIEFREIRKGDRQILQFALRKLAEKQLEESFLLEIER